MRSGTVIDFNANVDLGLSNIFAKLLAQYLMEGDTVKLAIEKMAHALPEIFLNAVEIIGNEHLRLREC